MAQHADITAILAALSKTPANGTPTPSKPPNPQSPLPPNYPSATSSSTPSNPLAGMQLPQPTASGNVDLSSVKPVNSGTTPREDPRLRTSSYRRSRSRSRSPARRDAYRDNHNNPYRDERRDDSRRAANGRPRSPSPARPPLSASFSPNRSYPARDRSPPPTRLDDNTEMITVDSKSVGLIIGRNGENLRRVEQETGARVQFMAETGSSLRQCKVSGNPRQRADAKSDILRLASENVNSNSASTPSYDVGSRASGSASQPPPVREGERSIQMMVPDRTVGLIIGRRGETIRDLQDRSGCHVNIVSENKSVGGYRPVNLIGTKEAAEMAQRLINEIVESDTRDAPSSAPVRSAPPSYGRQPYDSYAQYDPAAGSSLSETMSVPSEAVGMIIGKGGETIREMQSTTGCKINVSQPVPPDVWREIGLIGTKSAIEQAKDAITQKCETVRHKQGGHFNRTNEMVQPSYDPYAQPAYPYHQPHMQPPQTMPPPANDPNDPYAVYGGYANYCALWYNAYSHPSQGPGAPPPGH